MGKGRVQKNGTRWGQTHVGKRVLALTARGKGKEPEASRHVNRKGKLGGRGMMWKANYVRAGTTKLWTEPVGAEGDIVAGEGKGARGNGR